METAPLKTFATRARTDLIKAVTAQTGVVLAENSLARIESAGSVRELEKAIGRDGLEQVVDRVAYTWFNRIIALRFMDANGYTSTAIVSPSQGKESGQPEVLAEAKAGNYDSGVVNTKTQEVITSLLNGSRQSQDPQGEAYGLLLEAYCQNLNKVMPFMFEREGDYTELLLPSALLSEGSVRDRAVKTLTAEVCSEVEVIGWLYQFYIAERKDEVFEGFKKNKKAGAAEIPAATQLFTPHWIVRFLVENSVGRLWLLNNPSSKLTEKMDYYIEPVDEETAFLRISKPEELKVIDPAVGSGHMLTYAFDLLYEIYSEKGYDPAEIPGLILEHNLYGTEIDPRAGALAAFALTMKASGKRKNFLRMPIQPNICVLENIYFDEYELDFLFKTAPKSSVSREDCDIYWNSFSAADTVGSLTSPNELIAAIVESSFQSYEFQDDLLHRETLRKAEKLIAQLGYLKKNYSAVIANPPYMGSKNMDSGLVIYANSNYPLSKIDLYTMFIERACRLVKNQGIVAMITMQSWMFLNSFEGLRKSILDSAPIRLLAHLGSRAFDSIPGERVKTSAFVLTVAGSTQTKGTFLDLTRGENEKEKQKLLSEAKNNPDRQFHLSARSFKKIPEFPISYWVSDEVAELFLQETFSEHFTAKTGIVSGNNSRHFRRWSEVSRKTINTSIRSWQEFTSTNGNFWIPIEVGGDRRKWYGNTTQVVALGHKGNAIRETNNGMLRNHTSYFKSAVVWNRLNEGRMGFRFVPEGHIFDDLSPFVTPNGTETVESSLAILGSDIARQLLGIVGSGSKTEVGHVNRLPFPSEGQNLQAATSVVQELVQLAKTDWDFSEQSLDFENLELGWGTEGDDSLESRLSNVRIEILERANRVRRLQKELDENVSLAYGLSISVSNTDLTLIYDEKVTASSQIIDLISYAVGCMFGRYSIDKKGLILADHGDSLETYLSKVTLNTFVPDPDNVIPIVDGEWFEDDIVSLFRQFIRASFGEKNFELNLRFITDSLGVKDIRDYFVKSFYTDHVKRYKKRPIYWLFSSPKGSFNALIYLHRYTPSTASTVLTGYLREYIGKLEASLDHLSKVAAGVGAATTRERASAEKESDRILKILVELREYERDVLFPLAGKQISLDLDDGVLVNYQKLGPALKEIGLKKVSSDE